MKTFCIVIGKPLVVARCPLPAGSCTWQHTQTNFCKYTGRELSTAEHATLIGVPALTPTEYQEIEQRLLKAIRSQV